MKLTDSWRRVRNGFVHQAHRGPSAARWPDFGNDFRFGLPCERISEIGRRPSTWLRPYGKTAFTLAVQL